MLKRLIPLFVSIALLVGLLYYSDFFQVVKLLEKASWLYISIGVLLWLVDVLVRSSRWNFLLKIVGIKLSLRDTIHVYLPSLFISNVSPAKTGEVMRPVFLKTMKGKSFTKSLASIFIERFSDVVVLIIFSLVGLFSLSQKLSFYLVLAIGIYVVAFAVAFFVLLSEKRTKKVVKFFVKKFSWVKKIKKMEGKVFRFSSVLSKSVNRYKKADVLLISILYTFLVWVVEAVILKVGFATIGADVGVLGCLFALAISTLISVITFLPGGLGVSETIVLFIFSSMYGLTPAQIMAGMIMSRFYSYWLFIISGAIVTALSKYKV